MGIESPVSDNLLLFWPFLFHSDLPIHTFPSNPSLSSSLFSFPYSLHLPITHIVHPLHSLLLPSARPTYTYLVPCFALISWRITSSAASTHHLPASVGISILLSCTWLKLLGSPINLPVLSQPSCSTLHTSYLPSVLCSNDGARPETSTVHFPDIIIRIMPDLLRPPHQLIFCYAIPLSWAVLCMLPIEGIRYPWVLKNILLASVHHSFQAVYLNKVHNSEPGFSKKKVSRKTKCEWNILGRTVLSIQEHLHFVQITRILENSVWIYNVLLFQTYFEMVQWSNYLL